MIRRPPRSTLSSSSAASDVYKRQVMSAGQRAALWNHVRDSRRVMKVAYDNSHDVRLTFRWPLLVTGDAGIGRHTYRVFTAGQLYATNDPDPGVLKLPLYFFQPSTYVQ